MARERERTSGIEREAWLDIDGLRMQFGKVTERTDRLERAFVMAKTNADTVSDRRAVDVMELEEVRAWHYD
jgi:hypothetical protein